MRVMNTLDDNTSGKKLTDVLKNDDLLWLRPDDKTQVQRIPKQVRGIQPREHVVEVLIVLLSSSLSKIRSVDCV